MNRQRDAWRLLRGALFPRGSVDGAALDALLEQTDEAIGALNRAGIAPLLLKGAAYLKLATHTDPGARVAADLDLLVPIDAATAAQRALEQLGHAPLAGYPWRGGGKGGGKHHLVPLVRPGAAGAIGLHVAVMPQAVQQALPTTDAWQASIRHESGRFAVLSPSHMVLHRFIHDQIVDRYDALRRIALRSFADLLALDRHYGVAIDWPEVHARAHGAGYGSSFKSYLYVARRTAGLDKRLEIHFGARQRAYLYACNGVLRWNAVRMGFGVLDALWAFAIQKRHGARQSGFSMSAHRIRTAAAMLRRRLNSQR